MSEFIRNIDDEIAHLESRLAELRVARKVYASYRNRNAPNARMALELKPDSLAGRVIPIMVATLSDGVRRKTAQLLETVSEKGISIGGKSPKTGLAAMLSRRKDLFAADRKLGWTLRSDKAYA